MLNRRVWIDHDNYCTLVAIIPVARLYIMSKFIRTNRCQILMTTLRIHIDVERKSDTLKFKWYSFVEVNIIL